MSKNGKKDKKDKKDKKGGKAKVATKTPPVVSSAAASEANYSDGHPQDVVQYMEAKLILKPDRFVSVDSFRDFGKLVQRTAKKLGVGFISDPKIGRRPERPGDHLLRHAGVQPVQQRVHPAAAHRLR